MTQTPRPPRPKPLPQTVQRFRPQPGDRVRLRTSADIGMVIESDSWWDTLLLRGVDIADQVLVDWTIDPGAPVVRWERIFDLDPSLELSPPAAALAPEAKKEGEA